MNLLARHSFTLCVALLLPACKDSDAGETTSVSAARPARPTSTSTGTGTTATPTTTGSSTGEPPKDSCTAVTSEAECKTKEMCTWKGVVQYTHGNLGLPGQRRRLLRRPGPPTGAASAWYREFDGDTQVVEFSYTPDDLPGEWMECGCDGPLTCLCPSIAPDLPGSPGRVLWHRRLERPVQREVTTHGDLVCDWFSVSPEGPKDDTCADSAQENRCLPATNVGGQTCTPPAYTFQPCETWPQDLFWREVNGVVEVITICGPQPLGWTQCLGDDTPDQPDECKCRCL
jgi:hypothetical protein